MSEGGRSQGPDRTIVLRERSEKLCDSPEVKTASLGG